MVTSILDIEIHIATKKNVQLIPIMPMVECAHIVGRDTMQIQQIQLNGIILVLLRFIHIMKAS
ncbi:hypothetical protein D3C74_450250 [compost metagenome]